MELILSYASKSMLRMYVCERESHTHTCMHPCHCSNPNDERPAEAKKLFYQLSNPLSSGVTFIASQHESH